MSDEALPLGLRTRLELVLAGPGVESWGGTSVVPIATLESSMRLGLAATGWMGITDGGAVLACAGEALGRFYEIVEQSRDSFDEALEKGAHEKGLPPDVVALSFPAVEVVRAVLGKDSTYLIRLALLFLRTSELREMRAEIEAVTKRSNVPVPIRQLAERLLVG